MLYKLFVQFNLVTRQCPYTAILHSMRWGVPRIVETKGTLYVANHSAPCLLLLYNQRFPGKQCYHEFLSKLKPPLFDNKLYERSNERNTKCGIPTFTKRGIPTFKNDHHDNAYNAILLQRNGFHVPDHPFISRLDCIYKTTSFSYLRSWVSWVIYIALAWIGIRQMGSILYFSFLCLRPVSIPSMFCAWWKKLIFRYECRWTNRMKFSLRNIVKID